MKLHYINIITHNSVWVINRISNLLRKRNYSIQAFSAAFDDAWNGHIVVWIELNEKETIGQIISQVYKLYDVLSVENMDSTAKKIYYIFSVNWNCKKTLKKISQKPDKIIETSKELIYTFFIPEVEKKQFMSELANLQLSYTSRIIWFSDSCHQ